MKNTDEYDRVEEDERDRCPFCTQKNGAIGIYSDIVACSVCGEIALRLEQEGHPHQEIPLKVKIERARKMGLNLVYYTRFLMFTPDEAGNKQTADCWAAWYDPNNWEFTRKKGEK